MNDLDLRSALRSAASPGASPPDLHAVRRRARVLRTWRTIAGAVAVLVAIGAIAWPLHELGSLGKGPIPGNEPSPAAITFAPLDGWHTATSIATAAPSMPASTAATMANVPLPETSEGYPPGLDNAFLDALPPTGIAMVAQQLLFTRNPIPRGSDYRPATLPLDLSDGTRLTGGAEGLARTDLTRIWFSVLVDGRPVLALVYLGTDHPDPAMLRQAQQALDQLRVAPAPAPTDAIDQFGIAMPVPVGWHALLYTGDPTLMVATMPIDTLYWDSTRRAALGPDDTTIVLDESDALVELQGWAPLEGSLSIGDNERCDGCEVLDGGSAPAFGHVLYQRTFTTGGRAFSLYVEFGATPTAAQLDEVNALLAGITIEPLADPTYTPAPGATRVGPIYDGEDVPEVAADDAARSLSDAYTHVEMRAPDGWTGQTNPVSGLEQPMSALAAGSWNFTPGGYCGPINALRELPTDGALVWVDWYRGDPPADLRFTPKPQTIDVTAAPTDPSPCFGGANPSVFRWSIGGRAFVVHVALGPDATAETIAQVGDALASIAGR